MIDTAVLVTLMATRALHKYVVGSKSFRPDQLFKVTKKNFAIFQHSLPLFQHTFQLIH